MKSPRPAVVLAVTNDLNFDQRMQRIAATLQKNGFDCLLLGRKKRNSEPLGQQLFQQRRLFCFFEKGAAFYIEFNIRLLFFLLFKKRFSIRTEKAEIDTRRSLAPAFASAKLIFYAVDLDTIAPVWLAGRLRRARLFYDAHEYFSEVPEVVGRPVVKKIWEAVAAFFIPKMDAHLTVGPALAGLLGKRYGVDFEAIKNVPFRNLSFSASGFGAAEKPKILLYQGALNIGRGLEQAISAMPFLPKKLELWLAGEGDLSAELRLLAAEKGVSDRVRFLGFVRPADLPSLTKKAWLGLNLLEDRGLSYHYSLANKCFDYIQSEVPSLNMNLPEYAAINSAFEVSFLLENLQTETIVAAVDRIMHDEPFYLKMRENCRRAAKLFHWEKEEEKLLTLFRK